MNCAKRLFMPRPPAGPRAAILLGSGCAQRAEMETECGREACGERQQLNNRGPTTSECGSLAGYAGDGSCGGGGRREYRSVVASDRSVLCGGGDVAAEVDGGRGRVPGGVRTNTRQASRRMDGRMVEWRCFRRTGWWMPRWSADGVAWGRSPAPRPAQRMYFQLCTSPGSRQCRRQHPPPPPPY